MGRSTLDPDNIPADPRKRKTPKGRDTKSLGPSDSSDSGSDMAGPGLSTHDMLNFDRGTNQDIEAGSSAPGIDELDDTSDRFGTGERPTAGQYPKRRVNADLDASRIAEADEVGLGGGLDQAEEARLGKTDEEIAEEEARKRASPEKR